MAGRLALTAAEFLVADLTSPEATRPAAPNILLLNERNCLPYHVSTHQYGRFTRVVQNQLLHFMFREGGDIGLLIALKPNIFKTQALIRRIKHFCDLY